MLYKNRKTGDVLLSSRKSKIAEAPMKFLRALSVAAEDTQKFSDTMIDAESRDPIVIGVASNESLTDDQIKKLYAEVATESSNWVPLEIPEKNAVH